MLPQALQPYALTAAGHRLSATLLGHERRPGSLHSQAGVSIVESVQIPPGLWTRDRSFGDSLGGPFVTLQPSPDLHVRVPSPQMAVPEAAL